MGYHGANHSHFRQYRYFRGLLLFYHEGPRLVFAVDAPEFRGVEKMEIFIKKWGGCLKIQVTTVNKVKS